MTANWKGSRDLVLALLQACESMPEIDALNNLCALMFSHLRT